MNTRINLDKLILEAQYNEELYKDYEKYDDLLSEGGTPGLPSSVRQAEKLVQVQALRDLSGGDNNIVLQLIELLGGIFRKAIKDYRRFGKIPSEEQLLDFTSNYLGDDVWEIARKMKRG